MFKIISCDGIPFASSNNGFSQTIYKVLRKYLNPNLRFSR